MDNLTESKQNAINAISVNTTNLLETAVLAIAVAGLLYFGYFQIAPWIWSQNLPFKPEEITPWILPWLKDRDGIELYALYVLMFLDLFLVYYLGYRWRGLANKPARYLLALPLLAVAGAFIWSIGFNPPANTFSDQAAADIFAHSFKAMIIILPIIALLSYLQQRSKYWVITVAALFLFPVCFISTEPISWIDYQYILAPSLRLLHGAGVSEIYFQYDLMLSLIGLTWMKLQLDLNSFQIVGQCSYFLLFLGIFAFSRQWFIDKRLPIFLLVALVLVRIYVGPEDIVTYFQVTPLRLDLWLILLMLVYFNGPYHWSAGLFCGLMILLHKNFGIIYSAAYLQLLLTLFVIDNVQRTGRLIETSPKALSALIKKSYRNLLIILVSALAHYLLFNNPNLPNDYNYVGLGIGFIKIATNSFYWYIVVVSGLSFALLLRLRSRLPDNYLATGLFLIYLAIGNSLYFFGRSHENNIVNISAILLLLLFLLIDMVGPLLICAPGKPTHYIPRNLTIIVSLTLLTSVSACYGNRFTDKFLIQARNASKRQFIYPPFVPKQDVMDVIANVKSVTGNNPKVYFAGDGDFLMDYYGGYAPMGYYNPMSTWLSKRELHKFLQGLADQGYYLVIDNAYAKNILSSIRVSNFQSIPGCVIAWKK